jgi:hypothetical protein
MNSENCSWPSFSPVSTQNLKCHPTWKLCPSKKWTTFILVEFEVFRWNLENATKVPEWQGVTRGLTRVQARVWPSFVHKIVLTWLGVSLALSKVIKHLRSYMFSHNCKSSVRRPLSSSISVWSFWSLLNLPQSWPSLSLPSTPCVL